MLRPRLPDNEVKSDVPVDRPVFQKRNAASLKLLSAPFDSCASGRSSLDRKSASHRRLKATSQVSGNPRRTAVAN
jgi:hypothetical protein